MAHQTAAPKYDICKEVITKVFCYECHHFLCQSCNSWHEKFAATKRHTVTDSHNVGRSTLMLKLVLCAQCVTSGQKGHSITDIAEVVAVARGDVKNLLKQINDNFILSDLIEYFKTTRQTKLHICTENFSKEVNEVSQDFINIIETVIELNLTQASGLHALEKQQLLKNLTKLEKSYGEYNSLHESGRQILEEKHDVSFFLLQKSLAREFDLLGDIPIPKEPKGIELLKRDDFVNSIINKMDSKYSLRIKSLQHEAHVLEQKLKKEREDATNLKLELEKEKQRSAEVSKQRDEERTLKEDERKQKDEALTR
ncbi:unnamed protein product [Mytilus coruscus]|uniref:B box-type domain-containing protein n=1 Tax=Mytilus coruscus TaxID=42192 RepID=A0A6J8A128_MYTCO|nr:unnamed protein product [Mytilus coruscus]